MKTIAFFNNKGGVGKTSLVYHLAWMYADQGQNVVVADLDPAGQPHQHAIRLIAPPRTGRHHRPAKLCGGSVGIPGSIAKSACPSS